MTANCLLGAPPSDLGDGLLHLAGREHHVLPRESQRPPGPDEPPSCSDPRRAGDPRRSSGARTTRPRAPCPAPCSRRSTRPTPRHGALGFARTGPDTRVAMTKRHVSKGFALFADAACATCSALARPVRGLLLAAMTRSSRSMIPSRNAESATQRRDVEVVGPGTVDHGPDCARSRLRRTSRSDRSGPVQLVGTLRLACAARHREARHQRLVLELPAELLRGAQVGGGAARAGNSPHRDSRRPPGRSGCAAASGCVPWPAPRRSTVGRSAPPSSPKVPTPPSSRSASTGSMHRRFAPDAPRSQALSTGSDATS